MLMPGCGSSSSGPSTTPTTTLPTPPPPEVVLEGNFNLPVDFVTGGFLTTTRTGTIVATVDYTFANSEILVWIAQGRCDFDQFINDTCTFAATSFGGGDPRVVSVTGAVAGQYTLIVYNGGPADEAFSVQVVHTASAASASSEAAVVSRGKQGSWRGRRALRR